MAVNQHCAREGAPLARLESACGSLHIYDFGALELSLVKLPRDSGDTLFEGYSAESWAQYAKHKSNIASSTSKTNGLLKAEVADLKSKLATTPGNNEIERSHGDPLVDHDPW